MSHAPRHLVRPYLAQLRQIAARHTLEQGKAIDNLVELRLLARERAMARGRPVQPLDREVLARRVRRFGAANQRIAARGTEIEDYLLDLPAERGRLRLFGDDEPPALDRRMAFFRARVEQVFEQFYPPDSELPGQLIHVTCTGYVAPSAAQRVAARDGRTGVTHAYHMGCYAALPAVRTACGLLAARSTARVDVVHTEVCSLHFDPTTVEAEQIVVQSLFADGHIRYSLACEPRGDGFEVLALHEQVLPNSHHLMTWAVGPRQFEMTLAREVPTRIAPHLRDFVGALMRRAGLAEGDVTVFAVHPGGPKIIEGVERTLGLSPAQTVESQTVLRWRGNMSSATLPHIWQAIVDNPARRDGEVVVSLAFGPGLTLCGAVFRLCRA